MRMRFSVFNTPCVKNRINTLTFSWSCSYTYHQSEKTLTVVVDDTGLLNGVCGPNDQNLKQIEELFQVPVYLRGNEIFFQTEDPALIPLLGKMISELESHTKNGHVPGKDLINGIFESLRQNHESGVSEGLELLKNTYIEISPSRKRVYPRGIHQARYIQGMERNDIAFGIGPAGTGKTFLAVAYALQEIFTKRKRKLILTRPVVEAGESLGFLPGDLAQKLNPYLRPLYDAMDILASYEMINRLEESRVIEIAPLAYMRGRSISNAIIILDEAQNTTRSQMKMFLTRIGEGSKALITGDITQSDLPKSQESGLLESMHILGGIDGIHMSHFDASDVVRHPLVQKIIHAYENKS